MPLITRLQTGRQADSERQTGSLAALAVSLALVVTGAYLVEQLRSQAAFQDCVLSGRPSCDGQ